MTHNVTESYGWSEQYDALRARHEARLPFPLRTLGLAIFEDPWAENLSPDQARVSSDYWGEYVELGAELQRTNPDFAAARQDYADRFWEQMDASPEVTPVVDDMPTPEQAAFSEHMRNLVDAR